MGKCEIDIGGLPHKTAERIKRTVHEKNAAGLDAQPA
jgi:hypothetical protein